MVTPPSNFLPGYVLIMRWLMATFVVQMELLHCRYLIKERLAEEFAVDCKANRDEAPKLNSKNEVGPRRHVFRCVRIHGRNTIRIGLERALKQ